MRVAVDARMIQHSGIGTAIGGWLEGLAMLPSDSRPTIVLIGDPGKLAPHADALGATIIPFSAPIYSVREQITFPCPHGRWDLLFSPHYAHPLFYDEPFIGTVHDRFHIRYGSFGKRLYQRMMLSRLKSRRCLVITGSQCVRDQLVQHERFHSDRIVILPHGISERFVKGIDCAEETEARECLKLPSSYLLWVGIHQPHKNLVRLIEAVNRIREQMPLPLVLAGPPEPDASRLRRTIADLALEKWIIVLGRFEERMKRALYSSAQGLILPSLDEGYGFPPLEAMALGVPCAVSNRPPMNELLHDAAYFFDPLDVQAIADAMITLVSDTALRTRLQSAGLERAAEFSCEDSARKLVAAWQEALSCAPEAGVR